MAVKESLSQTVRVAVPKVKPLPETETFRTIRLETYHVDLLPEYGYVSREENQPQHLFAKVFPVIPKRRDFATAINSQWAGASAGAAPPNSFAQPVYSRSCSSISGRDGVIKFRADG